MPDAAPPRPLGVTLGSPQFQVLGIPVTVSLWHVLTLLFFFQSYFRISPAFGMAMLAVASLSVFLHEMGHGLVSAAFRLQPSIVLTGFGGFCRHQPARRPLHDFLITAAGPGMNFAIAGAAWLLTSALPGDESLLTNVAAQAARLNVFWGLYNLLPILPLDGGSLMRTGLRRFMKKPLSADRWAHRVSLGVSVLVALLFLQMGFIFGVIFMAFGAFENWRAMQMVNEIDIDHQVDRPHPRVRELLGLSRERFGAADYEAAMRYAHQARAEPALSPEESRHVWHILAVSAAHLGDLEDAIRYAERVTQAKESAQSRDMAQLQATCILKLADPARSRVFLRSPAAVLVSEETLESLRDQVRAGGQSTVATD